MRTRVHSYADLFERHQKLVGGPKVFSAPVIQIVLGLEHLHQARSYLLWLLSNDRVRVVREVGNEVFYSFSPAMEWIVKAWHPNSILPKGYWNGVADRLRWFDHLWVEEASA